MTTYTHIARSHTTYQTLKFSRCELKYKDRGSIVDTLLIFLCAMNFFLTSNVNAQHGFVVVSTNSAVNSTLLWKQMHKIEITSTCVYLLQLFSFYGDL